MIHQCRRVFRVLVVCSYASSSSSSSLPFCCSLFVCVLLLFRRLLLRCRRSCLFVLGLVVPFVCLVIRIRVVRMLFRIRSRIHRLLFLRMCHLDVSFLLSHIVRLIVRVVFPSLLYIVGFRLCDSSPCRPCSSSSNSSCSSSSSSSSSCLFVVVLFVFVFTHIGVFGILFVMWIRRVRLRIAVVRMCLRHHRILLWLIVFIYMVPCFSFVVFVFAAFSCSVVAVCVFVVGCRCCRLCCCMCRSYVSCCCSCGWRWLWHCCFVWRGWLCCVVVGVDVVGGGVVVVVVGGVVIVVVVVCRWFVVVDDVALVA